MNHTKYIPDFFQKLQSEGLAKESDILKTQDGFSFIQSLLFVATLSTQMKTTIVCFMTL